jgi:DNA-binding PadR family transcriptional regulator
MKLSGTAIVVLGMLALRPRSGYDIKTTVDRTTRFFWSASYGQIYPELRHLENAGLVASRSSPNGARARTVYSLTETGRAAIDAWLISPGYGVTMRDEGLLKLFFADLLSGHDALALVRARRSGHQLNLDRLREIERGEGFVGGHGFPDIVLSYGIGFHEWGVRWCSDLERRLVEDARRTKRDRR